MRISKRDLNDKKKVKLSINSPDKRTGRKQLTERNYAKNGGHGLLRYMVSLIENPSDGKKNGRTNASRGKTSFRFFGRLHGTLLLTTLGRRISTYTRRSNRRFKIVGRIWYAPQLEQIAGEHFTRHYF
jgi:hypothetical protein